MNNNFKKIILVLVAIVVVVGASQYFGQTSSSSNSSSLTSLTAPTGNSNTASNTGNSNLSSDDQAANAAITAAAKNALNSNNSASSDSATATVAATIASNSSLKTFNSLVQTAGLSSILTSPGPITVFAPTDAAFAKLPAATLANLQKSENKAELRRILSYHISNGKLASADLAKSTSPQTLAGLSITTSNSGMTVNNAQIANANINASNGIIHTIDTVLMPSSASVPTN